MVDLGRGASDRRLRLSNGQFFVRVAGAVAIAVCPILLWKLADVVLFGFGALLVAIMLRLIAEPFERWTPLPSWAALLIAGLIVTGCVVGTGWIFGSQIAADFSDLIQNIDYAEERIRAAVHDNRIGQYLLDQLVGTDLSISSISSRVLSVGTYTLEALVVVVISAAYLAAEPGLYRGGLLRLFPPRRHAHVRETMEQIGLALRLWLLGQFINMALIGALTTAAVWWIGLPQFLALGLIATVAEFIPYVGPFIAAVPALLIASTQGWSAMLWTVFAYVAIHQVEGDVVMPLVQRRMIYVPPALMLLGIAGIGSLFGFLGVIFAAPIVVTAFIAVKKLWVRDTLGEATPLPGEKAATSGADG